MSYNATNYNKQGGSETVIGGTLTVPTGGTLSAAGSVTMASGGTFTVASGASVSAASATSVALPGTATTLGGHYPILAAEVTFTETTGAGTYTGSVSVPAGATILDIIIQSTALWDTATSATLKVGDAADDDGWYTGVNLKATDLLVGEDLSFAHDGGKAGVYLAAEQRVRYSASARVISGVVTTVGASGSAGRTRMLVVYCAPTASAATKA